MGSQGGHSSSTQSWLCGQIHGSSSSRVPEDNVHSQVKSYFYHTLCLLAIDLRGRAVLSSDDIKRWQKFTEQRLLGDPTLAAALLAYLRNVPNRPMPENDVYDSESQFSRCAEPVI